MKQRYIISSTHREMRGLWYVTYSFFSFCLFVVLVSLPLAPVFADEVISEEISLISIGTQTKDVEVSVTDAHELVNDVSEIMIIEDDVLLASTENSIKTEKMNGSEAVTTDSITRNTEITEEVVIVETTKPATDVPMKEVVDEVLLEIGSTTEKVLESDAVTEEAPEVPNLDVSSIGEEEITEGLLSEINTDTDLVPESSVNEVLTNKQEIDEDDTDFSELTVPTTTIPQDEIHTVTTDKNKFSFSDNECITVGSGTFYCASIKEAPVVFHTDRIFSALDADGDKEIYVEKNGELSTLTSNRFDDDAPHYDDVSNTAVWHRLVDGRYQIVSFDFNKDEETQLTNNRFNNMEPSRFGNITLWQGWVGDDWEIFFLEDDVVTMLTDNTTHDITPSVNGSHVVWQSFENSMWVMKVYDIGTKITTTIDDEGGGSIENPRFVLVYDAMQETGDIETRGYDLKSGEVIHLASKPINLPEELPDADQTGEKRALVTTITQLKPKAEEEGGDEPTPDTTATSTHGVEDLVILGSTDELSTILDMATSSYDVIVTPAEILNEPDMMHISDVVIAPYNEQNKVSTSTQ